MLNVIRKKPKIQNAAEERKNADGTNLGYGATAKKMNAGDMVVDQVGGANQ